MSRILSIWKVSFIYAKISYITANTIIITGLMEKNVLKYVVKIKMLLYNKSIYKFHSNIWEHLFLY
jgi:hypothetical protein